MIFSPRFFLACLLVFVLSGCASVFDAPYEEEESLRAENLPDVELEAEEFVHEGAIKTVYSDIWARIRAGFVLDLPAGEEKRIDGVARRMAASGIVERIAERGAGLLYYVVEAVGERDLPMELVLVPFVESGYSLHAASHAEAHGAWQFIESTARNYEVGIDRFRDDRRNLVVSTRAALDYLQALHGMFGDWALAMAAYNCGERRVQTELDKARRRGVEHPGFKDIARFLPQETRDYVPRIFAVREIVAEPSRYAAELPDIPHAPQFTVVEIHRDIDVALVARLAGITREALVRYNPSLSAPVILGRHRVNLLLPHEAALALQRNMAAHQGPWLTWRMVKITRAATPQEIAQRNKIAVNVVLQANPLPEGHHYEVGSTLLLPAGSRGKIDEKLAERAVLLTRASSECMVTACSGDDSPTVPPATVNGLPRR